MTSPVDCSRDSMPVTTKIPISVITTCHGRSRHLMNLLTSLASSSVRPAEVIVVNDDVSDDQLATFDLNIRHLPTTLVNKSANTQTVAEIIDTESTQLSGQTAATLAAKSGFDIGQNRNIGAKHASHDLLVFLDVDCIVSYHFLQGISSKLSAQPEALLMGQPWYLTRSLSESESFRLKNLQTAEGMLKDLSVLNPHRYNLEHQDRSIELSQDYGAFWSLCFAITKAQFERIGGFDCHYVGYGAEDTDFAFMARSLNIEFYLTKDRIYHQQHAVYRPPLNHLASIVINANRFYEKWRHWPMRGWLAQFSKMGLVDWQPKQITPIRVIRLPSIKEIKKAHYPDAPFG